jgi:hypothetical protein
MAVFPAAAAQAVRKMLTGAQRHTLNTGWSMKAYRDIQRALDVLWKDQGSKQALEDLMVSQGRLYIVSE